MRDFFIKRNFIEVHPQSAQSILAACEDPETISLYNYAEQIWPLPQTGQMWLEHVLLDDPTIDGCFAVTTSFRNEPNPVPGRHNLIFPMFEFESKGNMNDLIKMEKDLLEYLGFEKQKMLVEKKNPTDYERIEKERIKHSQNKFNIKVGETILNNLSNQIMDYTNGEMYTTPSATPTSHLDPHLSIHNYVGSYDYPTGNYEDIAKKYQVTELEHEHEQRLCDENGSVYFIKNFPIETSPFWNMKMDGNISKKVDVILEGHETIGSAERSCDTERMEEMFYTISDGGYAKILFDKFGEERVRRELDEFLSKDFIPRYGGGIGMTRMIRAMEKCELIP